MRNWQQSPFDALEAAGTATLSRRRIMAGGMSFGALGLLGGCATGAATNASVPAGANYILRGGYVVTMDPRLGDLYGADVHIRNGVIVAVAPNLEAPGAEIIDARGMIVMPGFVDTHWHMWNSLFKNMVVPKPGWGYFDLKTALGKLHTPDDFYKANRLALTEAIDSGITSVVNYAHNTMTPAHVDAEIRALVDSGLRGRYAYGGADPTPVEVTMDLKDTERVKREWFGPGAAHKGRVDFAFSTRSPGGLPKVYRQEFDKARELGIPLVLHTGTTPRSYVSTAKMYAEGYLDKSTIAVHSVLATPADREALAKSGASNSFSMANEIRATRGGGDLRQQVLLMIRDGINLCLSFDASSQNPTSMFEQMRFMWGIGVPVEGTPTEKLSPVNATRCLEMATINGAKALGAGNITGSLTPGKRADVIMLQTRALNMVPLGDLHQTIVRSGRDSNIDTVISDGRFMKRGGKILSVNAEQVAQEASEALLNIRRRAGGIYAPRPGERLAFLGADPRYANYGENCCG